MVADPDYLAIRVYRSVGFADTEVQVGVERKPGVADPRLRVGPRDCLRVASGLAVRPLPEAVRASAATG